MSASDEEWERKLSAINQAISDMDAVLGPARERVERMAEVIFNNRGNRFMAALDKGLTRYGTKGFIARFEGENYIRFGPLRGGMVFNRPERRRANDTLPELPKAVEDYGELRNRLKDLLGARQAMLEDRDNKRLRDLEDEVKRNRDNARRKGRKPGSGNDDDDDDGSG